MRVYHLRFGSGSGFRVFGFWGRINYGRFRGQGLDATEFAVALGGCLLKRSMKVSLVGSIRVCIWTIMGLSKNSSNCLSWGFRYLEVQ